MWVGAIVAGCGDTTGRLTQRPSGTTTRRFAVRLSLCPGSARALTAAAAAAAAAGGGVPQAARPPPPPQGKTAVPQPPPPRRSCRRRGRHGRASRSVGQPVRQRTRSSRPSVGVAGAKAAGRSHTRTPHRASTRLVQSARAPSAPSQRRVKRTAPSPPLSWWSTSPRRSPHHLLRAPLLRPSTKARCLRL